MSGRKPPHHHSSHPNVKDKTSEETDGFDIGTSEIHQRQQAQPSDFHQMHQRHQDGFDIGTSEIHQRQQAQPSDFHQMHQRHQVHQSPEQQSQQNNFNHQNPDHQSEYGGKNRMEMLSHMQHLQNLQQLPLQLWNVPVYLQNSEGVFHGPYFQTINVPVLPSPNMSPHELQQDLDKFSLEFQQYYPNLPPSPLNSFNVTDQSTEESRTSGFQNFGDAVVDQLEHMEKQIKELQKSVKKLNTQNNEMKTRLYEHTKECKSWQIEMSQQIFGFQMQYGQFGQTRLETNGDHVLGKETTNDRQSDEIASAIGNLPLLESNLIQDVVPPKQNIQESGKTSVINSVGKRRAETVAAKEGESTERAAPQVQIGTSSSMDSKEMESVVSRQDKRTATENFDRTKSGKPSASAGGDAATEENYSSKVSSSADSGISKAVKVAVGSGEKDVANLKLADMAREDGDDKRLIENIGLPSTGRTSETSSLAKTAGDIPSEVTSKSTEPERLSYSQIAKTKSQSTPSGVVLSQAVTQKVNVADDQVYQQKSSENLTSQDNRNKPTPANTRQQDLGRADQKDNHERARRSETEQNKLKKDGDGFMFPKKTATSVPASTLSTAKSAKSAMSTEKNGPETVNVNTQKTMSDAPKVVDALGTLVDKKACQDASESTSDVKDTPSASTPTPSKKPQKSAKNTPSSSTKKAVKPRTPSSNTSSGKKKGNKVKTPNSAIDDDEFADPDKIQYEADVASLKSIVEGYVEKMLPYRHSILAYNKNVPKLDHVQDKIISFWRDNLLTGLADKRQNSDEKIKAKIKLYSESRFFDLKILGEMYKCLSTSHNDLMYEDLIYLSCATTTPREQEEKDRSYWRMLKESPKWIVPDSWMQPVTLEDVSLNPIDIDLQYRQGFVDHINRQYLLRTNYAELFGINIDQVTNDNEIFPVRNMRQTAERNQNDVERVVSTWAKILNANKLPWIPIYIESTLLKFRNRIVNLEQKTDEEELFIKFYDFLLNVHSTIISFDVYFYYRSTRRHNMNDGRFTIRTDSDFFAGVFGYGTAPAMPPAE